MRAIRVGVLGAGAMGGAHASAWARIEGAELAGVAGAGGPRAKALGERLGVPWSADPASLLDDASVDAIDVTVPTHLHERFVTAALERGKHVLCETPLAGSAAGTDAMIDAARASGRHLQVALIQRVADLGQQIRDIVRSRALGELRVVSTQRLWPGLTQGATHHGDALEELALFDIDLLVWTLGLPRAVTARAAHAATGELDHVLLWLEFAGPTASVEASRVLPAGFAFRFGGHAVFEHGTLEWRLEFPDPEGPPREIFRRYSMKGDPEELPIRGGDPYEAECRHFLRVLRGEADPALLDPREARAGLRVVDAARASLESGGPVPLEKGENGAPHGGPA
jgi:UDP-N-acetylglucosamine 3-dehydrogenase